MKRPRATGIAGGMAQERELRERAGSYPERAS